MTLGQRIYTLRTAAGLSQEQLEERLDVARQTISKWGRDASVPELGKLMELGDVFGVSLNQLAWGEAFEKTENALALERLAEEQRRSRTRSVLAVIGGLAVLLGSLMFAVIKALDSCLLRLHFMLYRYMTVGEYVYEHGRLYGPMILAVGIFAVGAVLLWKKRHE